MGRRGRAPMPTALKKLRGNPGRRPLNEREPQPDPTTPDCPDWLDEAAKAHWHGLVPQLKNMGVLTRIDQDALVNYCDAWSRWRRAVEFIQKNGDVFTQKGDDGKIKYVQQWPQVSIARNLLTALLRYQQELGLTPASRPRLSVIPGVSEHDEFEAFLKGPQVIGA